MMLINSQINNHLTQIQNQIAEIKGLRSERDKLDIKCNILDKENVEYKVNNTNLNKENVDFNTHNKSLIAENDIFKQ